MVKAHKMNFVLSDPKNANLIFSKNPYPDQQWSGQFRMKEKLTSPIARDVYIFERNNF